MSGDPDHSDIVTLAETSDETSAELIAGMLREEGVNAQAVGGHVQGLPGAPSYSMVRILVPASDYERAASILRSLEETEESVPFRVCPRCKYSLVGGEDFATCPECGIDLSDLAKRIKHRWLINPPPGEGRGAGALLAGVILVGVVVLPMLYIGFLLATHGDPALRLLGLALIGLIVLVIGLAIYFNPRRPRGPGGSAEGNGASGSGTQPSA